MFFVTTLITTLLCVQKQLTRPWAEYTYMNCAHYTDIGSAFSLVDRAIMIAVYMCVDVFSTAD